MQARPDHVEYLKLVYVQMQVCLRALDAFGLELPAVHLDASIRAMREKIGDLPDQSSTDLALSKVFSELDLKITQTSSHLGESGGKNID